LRVFLDSNVLISALIGEVDSAPVVLVDWLAGGRPGQLVTSTLNVTEVERNLGRKLPEALPLWQAFLQRAGIEVVAATKRRVRGINPKDAAIVATAVHAAATHLVTGDKRLLAEIGQSAIRSPVAVTPRQMLNELLRS
jgi:predicted nucleic acid-binding protein